MSEFDSYQEARWNAIKNGDATHFSCLGCGEEFDNRAVRAKHEAWRCDEADAKMRLYAAGYIE